MAMLGRVRPDDPGVGALLARHYEMMRAQTPEESCHVLPVDALSGPDMHLYALTDGGEVLAVGALRVSGTTGELKSMHTRAERRGQGLGRALLRGLMKEARVLGLTRLVLETGSGAEHSAARGLYAAEGFSECPAFGDYAPDPLSVFMARML
jgi:putative acetyltransferase